MADAIETTPDPARKERLPRNVVLLGWVSLLTDVSSEMLYPLVPIFLTSVLAAPMAALGLIEGLAEGTANVLKLFSGWWSDRLGKRKPFVIGGYALSAFSKPMLALATAWSFVLGLRVADRTGKGLRGSARDALIADSTPPSQRGRAFGLHRAMDSMGAVLGPLVAIYFMSRMGESGEGYRAVFRWAFFPAIAGVLLLLLVRERPSAPRFDRPKLAWSILNRDFRVFILVNLVFAIGNSSDAFLILRAREIFTPGGHAVVTVILAYVVYNLAYSLGSYPAGVLADRIGPRRVFTFGLVLFALVYAGFAFNRAPGAVWVLFAIYGFYTALTDGVGKAYASRLVQEEFRATGLGVFSMVNGMAGIAASVAAGLLWQRFGSPATFLYGAVTAILAVGLFVLLVKGPRAFRGASVPLVALACACACGRAAAAIPVCSADGDQTVVTMTGDGAGGALITWIDERRGADSADVYVQRITPPGQVAEGWPADGAPVCTARGEQFVTGIVGDGAGGAIVGWDDGRVTKDRDVYAGRILPDGSIPSGWPIDGVHLSDAGAEIKSGVLVVADGAGGAFIAWNDYSDRPTQSDVYAQHVLGSGSVDPAWDAGGAVVCAAAGPQYICAAAADGDGGFYLAWEDHRPPLANGLIYVQRVTATGRPAEGWPAGGKSASPGPGLQQQAQAAADGSGGLYIIWRDHRDDPNGDIYATRLSSAGAEAAGWPRAVRKDGLGWMQADPVLAADGDGGLYVAFTEAPSPGFEPTSVHVQHMTGDGEITAGWTEPPRSIGVSDHSRSGPRLIGDGAGGVIALWSDTGGPLPSLEALRMRPDGSVAAGWLDTGVVIAQREQFVDVPPLLADGEGGAWVVWSDRDSGDADVAMERVTASGVVLPGEFPTAPWPLVVFPNPLPGEATIVLDLPTAALSSADIFDAAGRHVRSLRDALEDRPSPVVLAWNGKDDAGRRAPTGVYVLRIVAADRIYAGRIVVIR